MYGDPRFGPMPNVGYEDALTCPKQGLWNQQQGYVHARNVYPMRDPTLQCYDSRQYHSGPEYQHYYAQEQQAPIYPPVVNYPLVPDLPCQQNMQKQWDYDSMCFNVDGQPCQYTQIMDLEDFMNNEKRKERSRVAARCRRTKEMEIFTELTNALPARKEEVEQLDKASVMRLAISYLRVRDIVNLLPENEVNQPALQIPKSLEEVSSELSYMKALGGFVLVLSPQGDIVYCSENISEHIGVSQMEIMGQSVYEFSHPCDHDELREALRGSDVARREILVRLKCTLTGKGRNVHLKSASYKVIRITGHMLIPDEKQNANKASSAALVAVGRPIPHPSNIEIPLDSKTFLSKHSLDMKFTYTDEALLSTLGFEPEELVGKSLYDYHHAGDSGALAHQFKSLFSKGQCETSQYRFLAKRGGYAWVQTQATVITDKQQKPVSVVCVNYVISGIEYKDEVFAAHQLLHAEVKPTVSKSAKLTPLFKLLSTSPLEIPNGALVAPVAPEEERPIPVTELIFAPRKKEMNKGYLMFSQKEGLTMLKDEPDDLTHLAPTAGDACIPLENSPFDMFDEFILSDNYCSLLGDDLANGSPVDSLGADSLLLSSPERQETDSSCEQSSLLTELSLDTYDSSGRSDLERDEGKSPYIPLSDELPLLEPAVMWGALPDNVSLARPQPSEPQSNTAPALKRLLTAPPTGPPPQDLITNIFSDQGMARNVPSWDSGVKREMKEDEEPNAKRAKRSPTPTGSKSSGRGSSSVLMNLLDISQQQNIPAVPDVIMDQNYPVPPKLQVQNNLPINKMVYRNNTSNNNANIINQTKSDPMSPLSLNINSPIYSIPSSPVQKELLSPYSRNQKYNTPSPGSIIYSDRDPYLSNKMQISPSIGLSPVSLIDSNMQIASPDFWSDTDMLSALDEVKI